MNLQQWTENNQKFLVESIAEIKQLLKQHISKMEKKNPEEAKIEYEIGAIHPDWTDAESLSTIDSICKLFSLTDFEKSILLLCAGVELDSEMAYLCARAQGNSSNTYPTFGLALQIFSDSHWSALSPMSPLRRFKLIDTYGFPQTPLTKSPLYIEERVLHYLTGVFYLENKLQGLLRPVLAEAPLVESHKAIADLVLSAWCNPKEKNLPAIQLLGQDEDSKMVIAKSVCKNMELSLWELPAELIPTKHEEIESFIQLWTRESILTRSGLYISIENLDSTMQSQKTAIKRLLDGLDGSIFVSTSESWPILNRTALSLEVRKPSKSEQIKIWTACLGEKTSSNLLVNEISKLVNQFDLGTSSIQTAVEKALLMTKDDQKGDYLLSALWESTRSISHKDMAELAQRIVPKATMDDLVLPPREKELLYELLIHVAQKNTVYEKWGFADKSGSRGLGITALFAGDSGTGKTMAAEVLANELKLDLFRIDLSMVVNKYIGETEKNLRKVFDAAEDGGAILFFDEADALFGKRSEVHDSHDRYANIEVGYLLQRMESYRGLAILATNMKHSIDNAFVRRIRFIVNFPFPDEKNRAEIWSRVFPKSTPVDKLNMENLSKLSIAGGNIRNIALNASFLAANQGVPVNMEHLKRAAKVEYAKMERSLTSNELGGWT